MVAAEGGAGVAEAAALEAVRQAAAVPALRRRALALCGVSVGSAGADDGSSELARATVSVVTKLPRVHVHVAGHGREARVAGGRAAALAAARAEVAYRRELVASAGLRGEHAARVLLPALRSAAEVASLDERTVAEAVALREEAAALHDRAAQPLAYAKEVSLLANLYYDQGAYARVEPLYEEALRIRREALGARHPHVATSLNNLGALWWNRGDYAKAETYYAQALDVRRDALGARQPDTASTMVDLADCYVARGSHAAAVELYLEALPVLIKAKGEGHPAVAACRSKLERALQLSAQ